MCLDRSQEPLREGLCHAASRLAQRINLDRFSRASKEGGYEAVRTLLAGAKAKTFAKLPRATCYAGSDNDYNDQNHSVTHY